MTVISGKSGTASVDGQEITPVTAWTLTISPNHDVYGANDTEGWKKRVAGTFDTNGSFNMKDIPSFFGAYVAGDTSVDLVLYTDQDIFTQTVVIEDIAVNLDLLNGTIVDYTIPFSGNGPLVPSTGSAI